MWMVKNKCLATFAQQNISKINSNLYHYKLKFSLTSKQKYNSKFQEFESVRTIKIKNKNDKICI